MSTTAIIIVNYRTAQLTLDAVGAIVNDPQLPPGAHVYVVEGGSGDQSAQILADGIAASGWCDRVKLLILEDNQGFAYGNNRGIEAARKDLGAVDYFFLLNPDTIARAGACAALVRFLEDNPQAGIAGARLEYPNGSAQASAFRYPSILSEFEGQVRTGPFSKLLSRSIIVLPPQPQPQKADWVSGAALMIRSTVLDQIGLMDENFFLYFEEVDLCHRANKAGFEIWSVPDSLVMHYSGQATGVTDPNALPKRRPSYWFHSRNLYFSKHHSKLYCLGADAAWLLGQALWMVRRFLEGREANDPPLFVRDFIAHRGRLS